MYDISPFFLPLFQFLVKYFFTNSFYNYLIINIL